MIPPPWVFLARLIGWGLVLLVGTFLLLFVFAVVVTLV